MKSQKGERERLSSRESQ